MEWLVAGFVLIAINSVGLVLLHRNGWTVWLK
jgi:hypothetical protein